MTRKHFKALAQQLQTLSTYLCTTQQHKAYDQCCNNIADICKQANGAFDRQLFLHACDCVDPDTQAMAETDRAPGA